MLKRLLAILCSILIAIAPAQSQPAPSPAPAPGPGGGHPTTEYHDPAASFFNFGRGSDIGGPAGTIVPDQFNGSLRYSLVFQLPPLRGFEPPPPILYYNSYSDRSAAGLGWSFDIN